ncbi:hypothetical protein BGZ60DRAFT_561433 [Tricladium varicosporioides]|nr:hypothetical protein BGZ60DRAFT_561433 [Hymenoscyphus varicosporioides]
MSASSSQEVFPPILTSNGANDRNAKAVELIGIIQAKNYSFETLKELAQILDQESYILQERQHKAQDGRLDPFALQKSWTGELINVLLNRLSDGVYPAVYLEQEQQFRALTSALILQRAQGIDGHNPDHYDNLKVKFQERHRDLQRSRLPEGFSREKWSQYQCNCMLVTSAEYARTFVRREERLSWTIMNTAFNAISLGAFLALAATTGLSSNSVHSSIVKLDSSFQKLCSSPNDQPSALFNIQEITRIILAFDLHATFVATAAHGDGGLSNERPAQRLALYTLGKILKLLGKGQNEVDAVSPARAWQNVLAMFNRDPPSFGEYHYFYGLVDCASQLARILQPTLMPQDSRMALRAFEDRMKTVITTVREQSLRWKAIEFLLITGSWEGIGIRRYEAEAHIIRRCLLEEAGDSISPSQRLSLATVTTSASRSQDSMSFLEPIDFSPWVERNIGTPNIIIEKKQKSITIPVPDKRYKCVGLSPDCKTAFFMNVTAFLVCPLANFESGKIPKTDLILLSKSSRECKYKAIRAAISNRFLAVIMTLETEISKPKSIIKEHQLRIFDYSCKPLKEAHTVDLLIPASPSCIAIRESDLGVWLAIGIYGKIKMYRYHDQTGRFEEMTPNFSYYTPNYLRKDTPKSVDFSDDGQQLVCITQTTNRVLVWQLSHEGLPYQAHFSIKKEYEPGTKARGIDSASLFKSPRGSVYMLCTTSPSSRRQENGGEWPFICPVPWGPTKMPPEFEHTFNMLRNSEAIVAGAISPDGKIVAMLEDNGALMLFPLTAKDSGIGPGKNPIYVGRPYTLFENGDGPTSSTTLRFIKSSDGTLYLYAVDNRGKLVRILVQVNP